MKKLILLLILIPSLLYAGPLQVQHLKVIAAQSVASGGSALLVSWDAGDTEGSQTQLNTYQEDSGTVTSTNCDFTPTGHDSTGHACYVDADGLLSFACTDGTSIDLNKGTIKFSFKRRDSIDAYGTIFVLGSGGSDFVLQYYTWSTAGYNIQFRYNSNRLNFPISTFDASGIQADTLYECQLDWDNNSEAEVHRLTINGTSSTGTWATGSALGTKPTISSAIMHWGNEGAHSYESKSEFDDIEIYSEIQE